MRTKFFIGLLLAIFMVTTGFGCKTSGSVRGYKPVTLEYWGVFEEADAIKKLTNPYSQRHPKIAINYRKFSESEYKQKLLEAWALGQGPDMFMVPNTRVREFLKFISPMPATMKAPVQEMRGTLKKEVIDTVSTYNGYTTKQLRDMFLDIVSDDVVIDGKIYGLPYSVDTLSVFYNRDILKQNNIPLPAYTWNELLDQAPNISKLDSEDHLIQSAVALGTTNNIPGVLDIVSTIMLQTGVTMGDANGPTFHINPESLRAIEFFLTFAKKGLKNYSWSKEIPSALNAFTAGKLAYFIGYSYNAPLIKQANPKLDFDIIPMFKPDNVDASPNYASYWVTVVTNPPKNASAETRTRAELSWQYLLESTQARNVKPFLENAANPRTTALRELVSSQQKNPLISPFANTLLNAQSWYRGYDYELAQKFFIDMIDKVNEAEQKNVKPEPLIQAAASLISQTYRAPAP